MKNLDMFDQSYSRRSFFRMATMAAAGTFLGRAGALPARAAAGGSAALGAVALTLPDLPYPTAALEPYIDQKTMYLHHDRHHGGATRAMVHALEGYPNIGLRSVEEILADIPGLPASIRTTVRNNGGSHWNHSLFWEIMSPDGGGEPVGALGEAIDAKWGSFSAFQSDFRQAAMTRFGSGWAWLLVDDEGELQVSSTPNQDNPLMRGMVDVTGMPILGLDVWEHAYYLLYQYRRGDYVDAWWNVVNWPHVDALYRVATR